MMLLGIEDCVVIQKEHLACCGHSRLFKGYFEELRRSLLAPLVFFFFLLIVLSAEWPIPTFLVLSLRSIHSI